EVSLPARGAPSRKDPPQGPDPDDEPETEQQRRLHAKVFQRTEPANGLSGFDSRLPADVPEADATVPDIPRQDRQTAGGGHGRHDPHSRLPEQAAVLATDQEEEGERRKP